MIPQEVIERVREETDIVGLVGSYIKLKRAGRNFVGLCPFHKDSHPSFNVSPERQAYYCFGCGTGGNALTFLMNYENVSFPEAVKRLAERLGIKIEYTAEDDPTKPLVQALEMCADIYEKNLWSDQGLAAQRYLASRGLSRETVKSFKLGLVPHDVTPILSRARQHKLSTNILKDAGVLRSRAGTLYPFLAGRIVFRLTSPSGRMVGFSGRVYGDDDNPAKYVNTPETRLFKKGKVLYGISEARPYLRREGALVVEGQTDVLMLAQSGFRNVIAPLGTAFTADHARLLSRYTDNVTLLFDGDGPGRKAALRALGEVLAVDLETLLLMLPEGADPDSYIAAHSPEEFRSFLEEASEPMPFLYDLLNPSGASARKRTAELMLNAIKRIPDRLRRELYLDEAASLLKINRSVLSDLARPVDAKSNKTRQSQGKSDPEERLFKMMVQSAEFVHMAAERFPPSLLPDGEIRELLEKLYALAESKEQFSAGEILDTLSESMQKRVSAWSVAEERYTREDFSKELANCLYRRKRAQLNEELKQAQETEDEERTRKILEQLLILDREKSKITYQES